VKQSERGTRERSEGKEGERDDEENMGKTG
jgi:hypothetical protein